MMDSLRATAESFTEEGRVDKKKPDVNKSIISFIKTITQVEVKVV